MAAFMIQFLSLLAVIPFACSSPLVPLAPRAHVVYDASELRDEYDYVVVGGGTSGLTVANRLTENPKSTSPISQSCQRSMPIKFFLVQPQS